MLPNFQHGIAFFFPRTFMLARNAWSGLNYTTRRAARGMSRAAKAAGAPRLYLTQRQPAGRRASCEMQNLRQRKLAVSIGQWRHGPNAEHRTACGALGCHSQNAPPASCPTLRRRPSQRGRGSACPQGDQALTKMLGVVVPAPPGQNAQAMRTPSSNLRG